ncbi:ras-related protein Rab-26 isoform X2 [Myotis daubentonii]|uniref:ras-related protein Rab-26 isoform X2 n=1 Tax=Myotis daubentonii TaxID=98922 RepID=UPI0028730490|nr:ras-related protein Rab-26 isoform X2 [Myotis daubentonii]
MSRKKTPKSKGASAPTTSVLPAANGPRAARPGTARLGPQAPPNGPPQPGRPSLGTGGDFYDVAFKVMLVGDSGVGKTCLLVRFKDGAFLAGTFISTVGIDFRIWDTAGQERFRSVTHAYYRDAHALLLLYDVTNKASFDNIQAWLTEIQEYAQHDVVLMLLGNKVDSAQERVVKREDGEKLAKLFAGVWAAFHGDQCQDGPQRGFGLHSHSKGAEATLHEEHRRAPLPAARLCQEGGPQGLLLQTLSQGQLVDGALYLSPGGQSQGFQDSRAEPSPSLVCVAICITSVLTNELQRASGAAALALAAAGEPYPPGLHGKAAVGRDALCRALGALCCPLLDIFSFQAAVPNPLQATSSAGRACCPGRERQDSWPGPRQRTSLRITCVRTKDQGHVLPAHPLGGSGSINRIFSHVPLEDAKTVAL